MCASVYEVQPTFCCCCSLTDVRPCVQALEFEAGQRNWLLQQDALHAAAETRLRQEVAASQAAVEAHRTAQLADWATQEQEDALRLHQVSCALLDPRAGNEADLQCVQCSVGSSVCTFSRMIMSCEYTSEPALALVCRVNGSVQPGRA